MTELCECGCSSGAHKGGKYSCMRCGPGKCAAFSGTGAYRPRSEGEVSAEVAQLRRLLGSVLVERRGMVPDGLQGRQWCDDCGDVLVGLEQRRCEFCEERRREDRPR